MKKILIVLGTRLEAIKMAPLVKEFQQNHSLFDTKVCVTAQHREILDQVLDLFGITSEYDLDIMIRRQDLYDISANVILEIKSVISDFKPDMLFVHGDTSTTFSTALAAYYQQIPVGHIEAGLHTGNIYSPWTEKANRQLTTQITKYHFTPIKISSANLLRENISQKNIQITGNTVIDTLFLALDKIKSNKEFELSIINHLDTLNYMFDKTKKIILVIGHRRENHEQDFIDICKALKEIALNNVDIDIVYPVHLNPNVQKPVNELLAYISNIYLIEPLQYQEFIYMMDKSYFIITDSGGVHVEALSLTKPILVMRETTERLEALGTGTVKLLGTNSELIVREAQILLDNKEAYKNMSKAMSPYGNGHASTIIVNSVINYLNDEII